MKRGVGTGTAQNGQGFAHRHAGHETTVGVPERDPRLPGWQHRLEDNNAPGQINRPDPSHLDHGDTVPPTADNRGLSDLWSRRPLVIWSEPGRMSVMI
jgi:hypothetical protein